MSEPIEGLKERYEQYAQTEDFHREALKILRRVVSKASRERLAAYNSWQKALKEREEAKEKA